jgi:hypothetical protein
MRTRLGALRDTGCSSWRTRLTAILAGVLVVAVCALSGSAGEPASTTPSAKKASPKKVKAASTTSKVYITGSRIPRRARVIDRTPDVELSVAVIERKKLDATGTGNLADALRKSPQIR